MGLRELKKERTRKAISDLATLLFIERGYHNVTTAEIAQMAEVSVPTLFKYFPTKESLVFDEDEEREQWLIDTVKNRKKGMSVLDALYESGLEEVSTHIKHKKQIKAFMKLIDETPELNLHANRMWMRHEETLADIIRKESKVKVSSLEAESLARFVLDAYHRSMQAAEPKAALKSLFGILKNGWKH